MLACLTILAVAPILWLNAQLHGTAFADTVGPLAKDPSVQHAMADQVAATAADRTGLDPRVVELLRREIPVVMRTPAVSRIWLTACLEARESLLSGTGGEIAIDIRDLLPPLADRLGTAGSALLTEIPDGMTRVVLVDAPALAEVRTVAAMTPTLSYVIPVVAAVLLTLTLLVSANRWRTLTVIGVVVAVGTLLEMVLIRPILRGALSGVEDETSRAVVAAIAEAFADSLRSTLIIPLVVAGILAVAGLVGAQLAGRRAGDVDRPR